MTMLIVEDDALHRTFLRSALRHAMPADIDIIEAENGARALKLAEEWDVDAVVLDLQMPELNGVEAARRLWRRRPETRILFWSNYSEEAYVRGISRIVPDKAVYGYILKSAAEDMLQLAIQGVFIGGQCVIDRTVRELQNADSPPQGALTESEREVLRDLCVGLTDKAIANRRRISLRTVQARLQALYGKLGLDRGDSSCEAWGETFNMRTRAISTALTRGLVTPDQLASDDAELERWLSDRLAEHDC